MVVNLEKDNYNSTKSIKAPYFQSIWDGRLSLWHRVEEKEIQIIKT